MPIRPLSQLPPLKAEDNPNIEPPPESFTSVHPGAVGHQLLPPPKEHGAGLTPPWPSFFSLEGCMGRDHCKGCAEPVPACPTCMGRPAPRLSCLEKQRGVMRGVSRHPFLRGEVAGQEQTWQSQGNHGYGKKRGLKWMGGLTFP